MKVLKTLQARAASLGERQFRFTISTGDVDREGDTLAPHGWKLDAYLRNPTVLWSHDHSGLPIARSVQIGVEGNALKATAEFPPPGIHPLADQIHDLIKAGFLATASVGFLPIKSVFNERRPGTDFLEQELLEWSIVNVPALPQALIEGRAAKVNRSAVAKWLNGGSMRGEKVLILKDESDRILVDHSTLRAACREVIRGLVAEALRPALQEAAAYRRGAMRCQLEREVTERAYYGAKRQDAALAGLREIQREAFRSASNPLAGVQRVTGPLPDDLQIWPV